MSELNLFPIIDSFRGENHFLSNFHVGMPIVFEGISHMSAEHVYQAQKTTVAEWRWRIRNAPTPGHAKRMGQRAPLRDGWDNLKVQAMWKTLRAKFSNLELRSRLVATYPAQLVEGNTWGDTFWGVCEGVGENTLGRLLMELRYECGKS